MNELPEDLEKLGVRIRKRPLRGPVRVDVVFFRRGDSRFAVRAPGGQTLEPAISVEELRERLGGNEGELVGPTGERHHITIPMNVRNKKGMMVSLKFTVIDEERRQG